MGEQVEALTERRSPRMVLVTSALIPAAARLHTPDSYANPSQLIEVSHHVVDGSHGLAGNSFD